jgi:hypothetical protein
MSDSARSTSSRAQRSPAARLAARLGYAVNGILNITIGALALGVVGGGGSGSASPNGALAGLAQAPGGAVLIWAVIVGLVALGLWQLASAVLERDPDRGTRWSSRAKLIGKGVAYLALGATAITTALRGGGGGGAEESLTARALSTPGGVVLIVLIGLGALGVGGYLVVKGARRRFLDDLRLPGGAAGRGITVLGVVGYVGRGIAVAVIGVLFIVAAFTADPEQAGGLDDALAALAALPFGQVLLIVVAAGFVAYGLYGIARSRFGKL